MLLHELFIRSIYTYSPIAHSENNNNMDESVYGFVIVALIGFFIVTSPMLGKGKCFDWCDVGKGLIGLALTSVVSLLIKGAVQPVKVVV